MKKELCVTTGYHGEALHAGRHYRKGEIDALMRYAASLGATRCKWIVGLWGWALWDDNGPAGFDMLKAACDAAHRHGIRFDAVFKPFEGGLWSRDTILPDTFPCPEGAPVLRTPFGLLHMIRPFLVEHPEMRLARGPGDAADPGGRIRAIRLIGEAAPCVKFEAGDISIWTSPRNGNFTRYEGPVVLRESLEWRPGFPYEDRESRVVSLEGLELPENASFFRLACAKNSDAGDITHTIGGIAELVSADGRVVPSSASCRKVNADALFEHSQALARLGMSRYLALPEMAGLLRDRERFLALCDGMFDFRTQSKAVSFGPGRELAIMRGKHRCVYGASHPVYPEVREAWLDSVRCCVDRGVDGVNIRIASHNFGGCREPWAYGFNDPVLALMDHPENTAEAARINGEAFTRFLREARELLHAHGKEIGVQLYATMFRYDERDPEKDHLPRNFDWNWKEWIRDIADYVELRGGFAMCRENVREVTDRIGLAAREAGIPFIYQGNRLVTRFEGPHYSLAREMDWVRNHPDITAYDLYETAHFTRIDANGEFEGSPGIAELVRRHG